MKKSAIVLPMLGMPTFVAGTAMLNNPVPSATVLAGISMLVGAVAVAIGMSQW